MAQLSTIVTRMQGVSVRTKPQFGLASNSPKDSDLLKKARPLVSYTLHGGAELLSAAGRSGVFIVHYLDLSGGAIATAIHDVVRRLLDFNAKFVESGDCNFFICKNDIEDFLPSLKHVHA